MQSEELCKGRLELPRVDAAVAAISSVEYAWGRGTSLVMWRDMISVLLQVEVVEDGTTIEQDDVGGRSEVR
jgi:hypothetical protein